MSAVGPGTSFSTLPSRVCFAPLSGPAQFGAAVTAIKEKAILSGKRIERREVGAPGEFETMTDEELKRALKERVARLSGLLTARPHTSGRS
jgi:hypothetical protein